MKNLIIFLVLILSAEFAFSQCGVSLSSNPSDTICPGGTAVITATVTGAGSTYTWGPSGTTGSTSITPITTTATIAGNIWIHVHGPWGNCDDTITIVVAGSPAIAATSITATPSILCLGTSTTLTLAGGTLGTGAIWKWYSGFCGGNYEGNGTTLNQSPTATTTYYVRAEGACNTTSCISKTVTVSNGPTASITGSTSFCTGGYVLLNANTGTGYSYQWLINGNPIFGATNSTYTAIAANIFSVQITDASGCSSTSLPTTVTVNNPPTASITPATSTTFCQGGSVVLNANTGTNFTYQWNLNGVIITGATTSTYTATTSGTYTVQVTDGCTSTSLPVIVTVNSLPTATVVLLLLLVNCLLSQSLVTRCLCNHQLPELYKFQM